MPTECITLGWLCSGALTKKINYERSARLLPMIDLELEWPAVKFLLLSFFQRLRYVLQSGKSSQCVPTSGLSSQFFFKFASFLSILSEELIRILVILSRNPKYPGSEKSCSGLGRGKSISKLFSDLRPIWLPTMDNLRAFYDSHSRSSVSFIMHGNSMVHHGTGRPLNFIENPR